MVDFCVIILYVDQVCEKLIIIDNRDTEDTSLASLN